MKYSDAIKEAEKAHGVGSDWYELVEGMNTLRVLSFSEVLPQHFSQSGYKGICIGQDNSCPGCAEGSKVSIKWLTWVASRETNVDMVVGYTQPKLAKLPHVVIKKLQAMQDDPDYTFSDFPMPYDIKITKKKTGSKPTEVEYEVMPGKESPIPEDLIEAAKSLKSPATIRQSMKDKKARELGVVLPVEKAEVDSMEQAAKGYEYPEGGDINPEDIPF
jgi:hypothetical protein